MFIKNETVTLSKIWGPKRGSNYKGLYGKLFNNLLLYIYNAYEITMQVSWISIDSNLLKTVTLGLIIGQVGGQIFQRKIQ